MKEPITDIRTKKKYNYDTSIDTPWKKGDMVRHKITGHPYKVIHIYRYVCTILIDLEDREQLAQPYILLPRSYDDYALDEVMQQVKKNDSVEWQFSPFPLPL